MQRTQGHAQFAQHYTFPDLESAEGQGWLKPGAYSSSFARVPPILAIDCEMCVTQHPESKKTNSHALICLSVVSGLDPSQVLLHTLVKPEHPVVDYVTHIHGIREEDLEDAPTFDVVQAAILKLVSASTILVGQSLHGDLHAMRLDHNRVIDTALMFTLKQHPGYEGPARTPALRDLAKFCLQKNIHEGDSAHDSRIDAQMAMEICMYELEYGPTALGTVPRAVTGGHGDLDKAEVARRHKQLRIHRVSTEIDQDMLQAVFTQQAMIVPQEIKPLASGKTNVYGATTVVFKSKKHADLAFECLTVSLYCPFRLVLKTCDNFRVR